MSTKLQKQAREALRYARGELARRHPEGKFEILAGEWDNSFSMQSVKQDISLVGGLNATRRSV